MLRFSSMSACISFRFHTGCCLEGRVPPPPPPQLLSRFDVETRGQIGIVAFREIYYSGWEYLVRTHPETPLCFRCKGYTQVNVRKSRARIAMNPGRFGQVYSQLRSGTDWVEKVSAAATTSILVNTAGAWCGSCLKCNSIHR